MWSWRLGREREDSAGFSVNELSMAVLDDSFLPVALLELAVPSLFHLPLPNYHFLVGHFL